MDKINRIAPNFQQYEFECSCGCGEDRMDGFFIKRLQAARTIAGISFIISSGARCPVWNTCVGGENDSCHVPDYMPVEKACAVDIKSENSRQRKIIISALLDAGFTRIGIGKDFIHVDDGERKKIKDKDVIWHYY